MGEEYLGRSFPRLDKINRATIVRVLAQGGPNPGIGEASGKTPGLSTNLFNIPDVSTMKARD